MNATNQSLRPALACTLALFFALVGTGCDAGAPADGTAAPAAEAAYATTSFWLPIDGAFPVTTDGSTELVRFTGTVHAVVQYDSFVPSPPPIRVYTNLTGLEGVGLDTGGLYRATGAQTIEGTVGTYPGSLTLPAFYAILPPSPILPPNPILPLDYTLSFDAAGLLLSVVAEIGVVVEG